MQWDGIFQAHWLNHHTCFQYLHIPQKNHTIDYHRLTRNNNPRKNLSITLKGIFSSRGLED